MKKKTNKHGFTIVELVIAIAIVAILAAVLIPTFINLTRSADETTALADARNYAQQLLPELIDCVNEAGDLIVIQYKNEAFYVHAYLVEDGRMLSYKKNPISEDTIENFYNSQNTQTAQIAPLSYYYDDDTELSQYADVLLQYLESQNVIFKAMTDTNTEGEWWDSSEMAELCNSLGFDTENTRVRADYKVIDGVFEQPAVSLEGNGGESGNTHTCSESTLTYHAGQTKTCVKNGWDAYYVCSCGKLYSDTNLTSLNKINIEKATGHEDSGSYIQLSGDKHAHKCSACGSAFQTEDCSDLFFEVNDHYEHGCVCGTRTLIDLANDTTLPATFKLAMQLNLYLAQDTQTNQSKTNENYANGKHTTMYSAFCAVKTQNSSYTSISDSTDTKSIVAAIDAAEKKDSKSTIFNKGYTIVWDQVIDRFVVVRIDPDSKQQEYLKARYVDFFPYRTDYWAWVYRYESYWVSSTDLYNFWDTYGETIQQSENNTTAASYSIYLTSDTALNSLNNKTIISGLDVGTLNITGDISINLSADRRNGSGHHILRTNGIKITVYSTAYIADVTVSHFGSVSALTFKFQNSGTKLTYHEYGTVEQVTTVPMTNSTQTITLIAESGSSFKQSKADLEKLGITFTDKGGAFQQNSSTTP